MSVPLFPAFLKAADVIPSAHLEKLRRAGFAVVETGDVKGEPDEIGDLPPEVRRLIHCVDSMRDGWAEGDEARKAQLWRDVHEACDAVWARNGLVRRAVAH